MPSKNPKNRVSPDSSTGTNPAPEVKRSATPGRPPAYFVVVLTVLYVVLAMAYNKLVPFRTGAHAAALIQGNQLATNPDEAAHYTNAVRYRSGHIPVFHAGDPDFEAHQPPLYYALIAPFISQAPAGDEPGNGARWVTILLGAILIWVAFATILAAFPDRPYLAQGTAACVALLPMNVSLCASISNDVLANLVTALGLWQIVRIGTRAQLMDRRQLVLQSLLLGAILAAGIYTKTSTLVLIPAIAVAAWLAVRLKMVTPVSGWLLAIVALGAGLLIGAPWLLRNTRLYGDPLAQHIFQSAFVGTTMTTARMMSHYSLLGYILMVGKLTFESFWGVFDSMQLGWPQPVYAVLGLLVIVSRIGLTFWWKRVHVTTPQRVILAVFAVLTIATVLAFIRFNMTFFQAQGRYLYPALVPLAFSFVAGFGGLRPKVSESYLERVPYYITGALVLLNAYSLYLIMSVFPPAV